MNQKRTSYSVSKDKLPEKFPTHKHEDAFWEALGRAVATFSMLEEVLGKAIFSFEATTPRSDTAVEDAYQKWISTLDKCLTGQLFSLTTRYEKAVTNNPESMTDNLPDFISELHKITEYRNVLCHGSWNKPPNSNGSTVPFFFKRNLDRFDTPINVDLLNQIQNHTTALICEVINTVTNMGWQFPGMKNGLGEIIAIED